MGYVRRKTFALMLDGDLAELEVEMRVCTVDLWLELCELTEGRLALLPENRERWERTREIFIEHAVAWDLEDEDGAPVPFTLEGMRSQDKDLEVDVVSAWIQQLVAVPVPLGDGSTGGQPPTSIPMDDPPVSRAS